MLFVTKIIFYFYILLISFSICAKPPEKTGEQAAYRVLLGRHKPALCHIDMNLKRDQLMGLNGGDEKTQAIMVVDEEAKKMLEEISKITGESYWQSMLNRGIDFVDEAEFQRAVSSANKHAKSLVTMVQDLQSLAEKTNNTGAKLMTLKADLYKFLSGIYHFHRFKGGEAIALDLDVESPFKLNLVAEDSGGSGVQGVCKGPWFNMEKKDPSDIYLFTIWDAELISEMPGDLSYNNTVVENIMLRLSNLSSIEKFVEGLDEAWGIILKESQCQWTFNNHSTVRPCKEIISSEFLRNDGFINGFINVSLDRNHPELVYSTVKDSVIGLEFAKEYDGVVTTGMPLEAFPLFLSNLIKVGFLLFNRFNLQSCMKLADAGEISYYKEMPDNLTGDYLGIAGVHFIADRSKLVHLVKQVGFNPSKYGAISFQSNSFWYWRGQVDAAPGCEYEKQFIVGMEQKELVSQKTMNDSFFMKQLALHYNLTEDFERQYQQKNKPVQEANDGFINYPFFYNLIKGGGIGFLDQLFFSSAYSNRPKYRYPYLCGKGFLAGGYGGAALSVTVAFMSDAAKSPAIKQYIQRSNWVINSLPFLYNMYTTPLSVLTNLMGYYSGRGLAQCLLSVMEKSQEKQCSPFEPESI